MTPTTRSPGDKVDDIDRLLSWYFIEELPHPWPGLRLPAPARQTIGRSSRWLPAFRSRFALAASLALLGGGALLLGEAFRTVKEPVNLRGGWDSATRETELFLEQQPDGPTQIRINIPAR